MLCLAHSVEAVQHMLASALVVPIAGDSPHLVLVLTFYDHLGSLVLAQSLKLRLSTEWHVRAAIM